MKLFTLLVAITASVLVAADIVLVLFPLLAGEYVHPQLKAHLWQNPLIAAIAWSFFAKEK